MTDLINRSTDDESAIKSAIKELKVNGYLHVQRVKDKSGRFNGTVWEYDDEPFTQIEQNTKNHRGDFPPMGLSNGGKSIDGKSRTNNNNCNNTEENKTNIKNIVNKERLLEICNSYYVEFAMTRWTKKQWNALIGQFVNELIMDADRLQGIYNFEKYIKSAIKQMAHRYDLKNGRKDLLSYYFEDGGDDRQGFGQSSFNPEDYYPWMDE